MLLSKHIRLLAAFRIHRPHLHRNPDPDAGDIVGRGANGLFDLPRSSLGRLRTAPVISEGRRWCNKPRTEVHPDQARGARVALGIEEGVVEEIDAAEPDQGDHEGPRPDLLFNGGIGTYIKAETESDADVG